MAWYDNISEGDFRRMERDIYMLKNRTTLNNSAIGRAGMEVYDGGVLNISNGGLNVVGSGTFTGMLYADGTVAFTGTFTQSGPTTFTGDTTLNGPTHINGATDIAGNVTATGTMTNNGPVNVNGAMKTTGTLDVEGVTTLKNNLNVTTGKIVAGGMTIDPAASGGSVVFAGGGGMQGTSGVTALKGAGNAGLISDTTASVFAAANSVDVSPSAVSITGPVKLQSLTSTASAANVYFDPISKQLYYKP